MQLKIDDRLLRNYLLESLNEEDFAEIDLRLIEDGDFASVVSLAESDLVEDFLDNLLSPDEEDAFRRHFLASQTRRRLLTEISDLRTFARAENRNASRSTQKQEDQASEKRGGFFRPFFLIPAFGILVIGAFAFWQLFGPPGLSPLEQEYASVNQRDLSDLSAFPPASTVNLVGGTLRDGSGPPKRALADLPEAILFRINVAPGEKTEQGFIVRIIKNGRPLFTVSGLNAYPNPPGSDLRVILPRSIFTAGQSQVSVENLTTKTTTNYYLAIE